MRHEIHNLGSYGELDDDNDNSVDTCLVEEDRARAFDVHNQKLPDRTYATFTASTPDVLYISAGVPCHMYFKTYHDAKFYTSCFDTSYIQDMEVAERYWRWISGDDSPYRRLFSDGHPEEMRNADGNLCGFFMKPGPVNSAHWLAHNFQIAARQVSENENTIRTWDFYVREGMDPADALYLSRIYQFRSVDKGVEKYVYQLDTNNGSHWPIQDNKCSWPVSSNLTWNFRAFREGDPDLNYKGSTAIWRTAKSNKQFEIDFQPDVINRYQNGYRPDKIMNAFQDFLMKWEEK